MSTELTFYPKPNSLFGPGDFYGQRITRAIEEDESICLKFASGKGIKIFDGGQLCCESRYITCDDDLASLEGHVLTRIEAKEGPEGETADGYHETMFIEIGTDQGFITLTTHNEHNGYYGGFDLAIREI